MNISPVDLFTALSHETRLRCLLLLLRNDELCVCELTHAIDAPQPHVSRHLAQLRALGVVTDRRDGLWIHYRINTELPDWAGAVLREAARGVVGSTPYAADHRALQGMPGKPGLKRCS